MHQMFSAHTTPEESKNETITGQFGFVFELRSGFETVSWKKWGGGLIF